MPLPAQLHQPATLPLPARSYALHQGKRSGLVISPRRLQALGAIPPAAAPALPAAHAAAALPACPLLPLPCVRCSFPRSSVAHPGMHQEVYYDPPAAAYSVSKRACGGGGGSALALACLTSDPMLDLVYRRGLLPLKDLRALMDCTRCQVGAFLCWVCAPWPDAASQSASLQPAASLPLHPCRPSAGWRRSGLAAAWWPPPRSCAHCAAPLSCAQHACGGWRWMQRAACWNWACP